MTWLAHEPGSNLRLRHWEVTVLTEINDAFGCELPQDEMNFTVGGLLLDQVDQQWQVAVVALVLDRDLGSSEYLEDVAQEEVGSVLLGAVARGTLLRKSKRGMHASLVSQTKETTTVRMFIQVLFS